MCLGLCLGSCQSVKGELILRHFHKIPMCFKFECMFFFSRALLSFITRTHTHNHTHVQIIHSPAPKHVQIHMNTNTWTLDVVYNSFVFTVLPNLWKCINNQVLEIKCEEQYNKKLVFYGHFIFLQYIYYMQMWSSIFFHSVLCILV